MRRVLLLLFAVAIATPGLAAEQDAAIQRGHYLTRLGDCRACHTEPGRAAFAGGRPITTPFGVIYASNITPDLKTGIGSWSFEDFYRALHLGRDKHGNDLYPAFPFPAYTHLKRADVKAIWSYLQSVAPVRKRNKPNELRWPYRIRSLLGLWRRFYFTPGTFKPDPKASSTVNRGAYLVRGLAHCGACHTPRNRLGATLDKYTLAGGTVPVEGWYAPNITPNASTGIGAWSAQTLHAFLTTGRGDRGAALGPMRDVVQSSLQHLNNDDAKAVVAYVKSVPAQGPKVKAAHNAPVGTAENPVPGAALYHKHCAGCHGDEGRAKHDYYPDLRDNSVVLSSNPTNLVLMMLRGGFEAATKTHPYPYSMPPFGFKLNDGQIADIANYVRRNWNRRAVGQIQPDQVESLR